MSSQVLLSGGLTWLTLSLARAYDWQPSKRSVAASVILCMVIAIVGPIIAMTTPKYMDADIIGCYVCEKNIYTNPLSSTSGGLCLPYIFRFDENAFIVTEPELGNALSYTVRYCNMPVGPSEFSPSFFSSPDLTQFKERYLLAVISESGRLKYQLYRMDSEIWLAEYQKIGIWSINRLVKTEVATIADLFTR